MFTREVSVKRLRYNWTKAPDVFRYLYQNPEVYRYFQKYLKEYQPDVLHITSLYSLTASIIQAAGELGIPVVLTATDFWFVCAKNTLLRNDGSLCPGQDDPWECTRCLMAGTKAFKGVQKVLPEKMARSILLGMGHFPWITNQPGFRGMMGNWQQRFAYQNEMLRKADLVVTASKFLRDLYLKYQVLEDRIIYSAYGLDMTWARGFTTKTESRCLRIGFIGQVIPMKGVDLLLKAVQLIGRESPIEVKIYGDLQKNLEYGKELIALKGNDERISFLGTFDNSRMGEVMMEIDVLVVPSSWYDFPLVVSSALATRTPVIATDLPGMNELIKHGKNGLLFARNDWKALAAQMKRLVDEKDLLLRLKEGIEPVKTVAEMSAEYKEIYARTAKRQDRSV